MGLRGRFPLEVIILLIFESLSIKHDCMSDKRPSVVELPVISKCISISGSTSLAFIGKSDRE